MPGEEKTDIYNTYNTLGFSSLVKEQVHVVLFFNENIACAISLDNRY